MNKWRIFILNKSSFFVAVLLILIIFFTYLILLFLNLFVWTVPISNVEPKTKLKVFFNISDFLLIHLLPEFSVEIFLLDLPLVYLEIPLIVIIKIVIDEHCRGWRSGRSSRSELRILIPKIVISLTEGADLFASFVDSSFLRCYPVHDVWGII